MYTIEPLNSECGKKVETTVTADFVKISTNDGSNQHCIMPQKFVNTCLDRIKNMEIYEDDTFLVTYPKVGTTWAQEMLWLIINDLNYEEASKVDLLLRAPFIE